MKISDFVIGLGFDASNFEKGMKTATGSIGSFRSDVLQLGATLGSALGFKEMTFGFARQNLELKQLSAMYGELTDDVYGLNEAAKAFGAGDREIVGALNSLATAKAEFEKVGKIGIFEDFAKLGVDFDKINSAKSNVESMYILADQLSKLDEKSQLLVAKTLGLSPQTLDLLKQGRLGVEGLSKEYQKARPHTEEMAKASKDLVAQWNELEQRIGGRVDRLSTPIVKEFASVIDSINNWFDSNQKIIDQGLDVFIDKIINSLNVLIPLTVAFSATKLVKTFASLAKLIPSISGGLGSIVKDVKKLEKVGEKAGEGVKDVVKGAGKGAIEKAGSAISKSGLIRMIVGVASRAYWPLMIGSLLWDMDQDDFKKIGLDLPDWMFKPVGELLEENSVPLPQSVYDVDDEAFSARSTTEIHTTANFIIEVDGEVIGTKSAEMINGQIRSAKGDIRLSESY